MGSPNMHAATRARALRIALLVGIFYLTVGTVTAALARTGAPRLWGLVAWGSSAVAFAAQIVWEHARLHTPPRHIALHAALASALGGFGLAAAAGLHAAVTGAFRFAYVIALVAWPLITGVPAFVVALIIASALSLIRRKHDVG